MLDITYKSNKLERVCTIYEKAKKQYGDPMATKIHQRINELQAADSIEMLVQYSVGRCHPLNGNRMGQYAMDLVHPFRLVFKEKSNNNIESIQIESIEDYH